MKSLTDDTPELGRVPAYISRYWKPALNSKGHQCVYCGKHFYHILAHTDDCEARPDDVKKRDADFAEWYARQKAAPGNA